MNDNKTDDNKKNNLGSSQQQEVAPPINGTCANSSSHQAKVVSISQFNDRKKLELINQIVKTTPSF